MAETKLRLDVYHHFGPADVSIVAELKALEKRIMSALSDKIAAVNASLDAALERVQDDVDDQAAKIRELEAAVASGTATPQELDALDALKAKLDALDPVKPNTLPVEPDGSPDE